jgi:phosphoglycerol transferase MdoB-like AlkP superfamily enzyme
MKALLKYCITLFATWLLLFFVNRIFFLCYQLPIGSRIIHSLDILKSFVEGYRLEISTACILLCLPLVFALLYYVFQHKIFLRISLILVTSLLVLYNLTSLADAGIYREWNAKINLQALAHFKNPSEVAKTISWHLLGVALLALIVFSLPFYYLYKNKILPLLYVESKNSKLHRSVQSFIFLALSAGIIVIGIRGGITNIPINQSAAYFSNDVMANDIAVNPLYNILQDVTITGVIPDTTVYKLRSNIEAQQIIADDFYKIQDTFPLILNTTKPNLVFIFLESWSADNVGVLGGVAGCTPSFDALSQEGVLFENAYGEAYVSDQGIPAVLSSYPSVSRLSIINQPIKVPGMHCISETLLPLGYTSSFMFGGDLVYGNLRGYLLEKKFTNLLEERDYASLPKGKLGIHDEYLFPELLKKLNNSQQPFLQGFFTVSTHMPYDFKPCDNWQSTKNDAEKSKHGIKIHCLWS